jgi:biotin-[acetyl-CoA-carboxylase] ligase BirA-like protein
MALACTTSPTCNGVLAAPGVVHTVKFQNALARGRSVSYGGILAERSTVCHRHSIYLILLLARVCIKLHAFCRLRGLRLYLLLQASTHFGHSPSSTFGMASARRLTIIRRHLASVDSTNTYAKSNMSKFDPNFITMITAGEQTAGRGRLGRTWTSTKENADITATFAFRIPPECMPSAYQLSPLLAISASKALAEHGVDAAIKWPNDLIIGTCNKVGGILCELENVDGKFWAALGIGMNINSMPEEIGLDRPVWPLSTLRAHQGKEFDVAKLTNTLANQFEGVRSACLALLIGNITHMSPFANCAGSGHFREGRIRSIPSRI